MIKPKTIAEQAKELNEKVIEAHNEYLKHRDILNEFDKQRSKEVVYKFGGSTVIYEDNSSYDWETGETK